VSRRPRWSLVGLLCGLLAATWAGTAAAHPLGNFTINTYSRLDFAGDTVRLTYIVDLAEIPTFQLIQEGRLDPDKNGILDSAEARAFLDAELPRLRDGLQLLVGGQPAPLQLLDQSATFVPGQADLPTLRIETHHTAPLPAGWASNGAVTYADTNYRERLGWREILARGGPGIVVSGITGDDQSDELLAYPQEQLNNPVARREVAFAIAPGEGGATANTAARAAGSVTTQDTRRGGVTAQVASLIGVEDPTPTVILAAIVGAIFWGAAHALSPGHGKTVVGAYLIGTRGTAKHAAFLGLTVTITHTAGVFALGGVTLWLARYLLPEQLYPWLNVASGLLVVIIGLSLVAQRLRGDSATLADHDHAEFATPAPGQDGAAWQPLAHSHGGRTHTHMPPGAAKGGVTWRSLFALGVSGGLIPCPSALVLLLSAISLGRIGFGMVLVVAFSAGLAIVLTAIGLLCVYARRLFARFSFEPRLPRFLPVASAFAITLAGGLIVLDALRQAGIV
jgi:ABC-type nickel/cobalt efflux system permease component RcnA